MRQSILVSRVKIPALCFIITVFLIVLGCVESGPRASATIELIVTAPVLEESGGTEHGGTGPLTMMPAVSLEIAEYTVTGQGPDESAFELTFTGNGCVIDSVVPGSWTVFIEGRNADGLVVVTGKDVVEVTTDVTKASVELQLVPGSGEISVKLAISGEMQADFIIQAAIKNTLGDVSELSIEKTEPGVYLATGTAQSGIYLLDVGLYSVDGTRITGSVSVIYLLYACTTSGEIDLASPDLPTGELVVSVDGHVASPPKVTVSADRMPPYFVESAVTLTAVIIAPELPYNPDYRISWYFEGTLTDLTDRNVSWTPEHAGSFRFDVVVFDGIAPVASDGVTLEITKPMVFGAVTYLASLFDNVAGVDGLSGVRDTVVAPSGEVLYAAGSGESSISIFLIHDSTSMPLFHQRIRTSTDAPLQNVSALDIAPSGLVLGAVCGTPGIALLDLDANGIPSGEAQTLDPGADSGLEITSLADIAFSPDGRYLFAICDETNYLVQYRRTPDWAVLEPVSAYDLGVVDDVTPTREPIAISVSPDSKTLAISGKTSDSVAIYSIDPDADLITLAAYFSDGIEAVEGLNGGGGLAFSDDGTFLYAVGYYDSAVSLYENDPDDGWSYIASYIDGENDIAGMHYPRDVSVSPDGSWVYVVASGDDSLAVFQRNTVDGSLAFVDVAKNGEGTIAGLDGARSVSQHPTGGAVYVAASNDSALSVFAIRDQ